MGRVPPGDMQEALRIPPDLRIIILFVRAKRRKCTVAITFFRKTKNDSDADLTIIQNSSNLIVIGTV